MAGRDRKRRVGVGGARIRAKTMRISINKEAKRRQQRQWVWLQPKQGRRRRSKRKRRGPRQKKQQKTEANGSDGGARGERRRRHHLSNTHTQRSSKVLSLQLSRQAWPRQQRQQQQQLFLWRRQQKSGGSEGWHRPWACTTPWHRLAFCGNHYRNENINDVKMLCPGPGPGSVTAATFIIGNPIITASDCNIINKQLHGPLPLQYILKVHPYRLILTGQFFLLTLHLLFLFLAC